MLKGWYTYEIPILRGSRNKLHGLCVQRALFKASDARQDLVGGFGPHERLRILVVGGVDELPDRRLEFADAAVRATTELFVRQFGEPAFDEGEPRAIRRRKVDVDLA